MYFTDLHLQRMRAARAAACSNSDDLPVSMSTLGLASTPLSVVGVARPLAWDALRLESEHVPNVDGYGSIITTDCRMPARQVDRQAGAGSVKAAYDGKTPTHTSS